MLEIQILVFCKHPEILETIIRLLNRSDRWRATGAQDMQQGLGFFQQQAFDLVLLGSGFNSDQEAVLIGNLRRLKPDVIIVEHFGGGSGLLSNEIRAALDDIPGTGPGTH